MQCKNHPGVAAMDRCTGCAEAFCANCLVEIQGRRYCGSCKVLAVQGGAPPVVSQPTRTCKAATESLILSIVGLICCGIILEPWALAKASNAKKEIDANPNLGGRGMATAAQVIAIIGLILWVIGMVIRLSQMSRM